MPLRTPDYGDDAEREQGAALLDAWRAREDAPDAWTAARKAARYGPTLHTGEIVGDRFRLIASAGDGPLATTWSADDLQAEQPVSIKVLHGQHANDPAASQAFEAAASATHAPVPVIDPGGTWEGFRWFAVEGDPGQTLHGALVHGGLGPAVALELVVEAGRALAALHDAGGIHGLVSPDAIRVDPTGVPRLHDAGLFTPSAAMGVAWLAPERLDPQATAGPAADVYGLALSVLFALNGGELPFWAWRDPERLVDTLDPPDGAAEALRSAVCWDPDERTLTVDDLLEALLSASALRRSLARACLETDRPQTALDHLDALRRAHPDDPDLLADRARALDALDAPSAELAWQEALDLHRTRAQARRALEALVARSHGTLLVARGRALLPLLTPHERPKLQHRLGRELLAEGNGDAALPFLEGALDGGVDDPELADIVERLQTERGDWADVVSRLNRRARDDEEAEPLRQAIAIARYAIRRNVRSLQTRLLALEDNPAALRDEARAVEDEGGDPTPLLERLVGTGKARPEDAVTLAGLQRAAGNPDQAEATLRCAFDDHPQHLGLRLALARVERDSGQLTTARKRYDALGNAIAGLDLDLEVDLDHARAELAWLFGDLQLAADLWHRRLDAHPVDRRAWWGLARVAFRANESAPWLGATPAAFTPEEALTRLLAGLLDPDAVVGWLAASPRGSGAVAALGNAPILVLCAAVVDELSAADAIGPDLFAALDEAYGEAALAIEAVRWMWCEPAAEPLFAIADCYRWTGRDEAFDVRVTRRVLHLPQPRTHGTTMDFEPLVARGDRPLPIEEAWVGGTPTMAPERANRTVIAALGFQALELDAADHSAGGDPADDLVLPGLDPGRVRFEKAGDTWYAVSDRPIRVDGEPRTETRLRGGQRITVDGHTLHVHELPFGVPVPQPSDDLDLEEPDWPEGEPHAVLYHRRGTRQEVLPFAEDVLALGPDPHEPLVDSDGPFLYKLRFQDGNYTLEDRTDHASELPPVLPLQPGDTFAIGDRTFTFELYDPETEDRTHPGDRAGTNPQEILPMLVPVGGGGIIPLIDDVFSIGRGGGNDLQLGDDPEVSRHHCMLVRGTDGACILRDSGSANGTYVNGRVIERHILQVGDVLQIGHSRLEFRLGRREELEDELPLQIIEEMEDTDASRAETAAFRRPGF